MSQSFLEKEIKSMPLGKATGLDRIPAKILKMSRDQILAPFSHTINLSFNTSNVPHAWKVANVTTVYKPGDHEDMNNYWAISFLTVVSKIVERFYRGCVIDLTNGLHEYWLGVLIDLCLGRAMLQSSVDRVWFAINI